MSIKFEERDEAVFATQMKYIEDILKKFNKDQCRSVVYPMEYDKVLIILTNI